MRCVNCEFRISRLQRHRLSDQSEQILERVRGWVYPRAITEENYLCNSCWVLINQNHNEKPGNLTQQQLGHRNVCTGCGKSILRKRSRLIFRQGMSEKDFHTANIITQWIRPRQLTSVDKICIPCYLRAQREIDRNHRNSDLPAPSTGQGENISPIKQELEELVDVTSQGIPSQIQQLEPVKVEEDGPSTAEGPLQDTYSRLIVMPTLRRDAETTNCDITAPSTSQDENISMIKQELEKLVDVTSQGIPSQIQQLEPVKVEEDGPSTAVDPLQDTYSRLIVMPTLRRDAEATNCDVTAPSTSQDENTSMIKQEFEEPVAVTSQDIPSQIQQLEPVENEEDGPSTTADPVQDTSGHIVMPTLRRAAETTSRCLFLKCNNSEKRRIPDSVRKHVIKKYNFYIPKSARICNYHMNTHLYYKLYAAENTIMTFSAAQIEEMVFLLADDTQLDFQNPLNIDDHLFKYWFGRTKEEFKQILIDKPRLQSIKLKSGLAALLCKMRTGDSNERISALFQIPRRTLEGYMKQAREILNQD
ncbi:uncharacterized protein LOC112046063 [Bicyclus anynana]|uniref:Uncharacterized protein LOC112046063 n=1 Tax=Bicyclus anynana TaxID=110368 RepID=A0ABM3LIX8_BICAN|nr:uncharacterized protein LOC112046063 [Bicyclus anynana]